jgi:hypothetical protein
MSRQDSRVVERTVAALETLLASGVRQVDVRRVLVLLGRPAPEPNGAPEPRPQLDPRADPLTGCLPVTAQGGHSDSSDEKKPRTRQVGFRG